mmetsp:Transcript_3389/g.6332  ORF Transcript_3389/g.6332 Transcript_3389/m.6332 type:complete len:455 (-) Transcript_3389:1177-2541(-)
MILTKLQSIDPNILFYDTTNHIIQSSAEGFAIKAYTSLEEDEGTAPPPPPPRDLFVKYVEPKKYSHKVWADLKRTVHYTRTEVRFYNEILPLLKTKVKDGWPICPTVYLAEYELDGLLLPEDHNEEQFLGIANILSNGTSTQSCTCLEEPKYDESDTSVLDGKYGILVMDNLKEVNNCFQTSPLESNMAQQSVKALAKFHAIAFQNHEILTTVSSRLCRFGGSYHLKNRNPKEMQHLEKAFDDFMQCIGPQAPLGFFDDTMLQNLGKRVYHAAEFISQELSPSPSEPFATIVHGDYKAMNIFFPMEDKVLTGSITTSPTPFLIDFASTGVGLGVSDLAMHIAHAISCDDLDNGMEERLFHHYYDTLQNALPHSLKNVYSKKDAWRHYKFATVDYFRFILGRQWKGVTMQVFEKRCKDTNFGMVNRCTRAALHFVKRADVYLREIEEEMQQPRNY